MAVLDQVASVDAFSNVESVSNHRPVRDCFPVVSWGSTAALSRSLFGSIDGGRRLLDHPPPCQCGGKGYEGFVDDLFVGGIVIRRPGIEINPLFRLFQWGLQNRVLERVDTVLGGSQVSIQKNLILHQLRPSEESQAVDIYGWIVAGNLHDIVVEVLPAAKEGPSSLCVLGFDQFAEWKFVGVMLLNESTKMQEMFEMECGPLRLLVPSLPPS